MKALTLLFVASTLLLAGCPIRDKDPADGGIPGGGGSSGRGGIGGAAGGWRRRRQQPNSVSITAPSTTVYTNASVAIAIATAEPTTMPVTLTAVGPGGSQTIGTITEPQTSFLWSTTGVGEGTYTITAQLSTNGTLVTSNTATIIVDRTPPQVATSALIPAIGATNVVLAAPIEAVFSEAILPSTINPNAIPIQTASGSTLPTTVSLSADGTTATIAITSDKGISLNQAFGGTFAKTITDLAGNALVAPSTTWSWNVPAWIKYAPITSHATRPILAVGAKYQPVVAYTVCGPGGGMSGCPPVAHVAISDGQAWDDLGTPAPSVDPGSLTLFVDAQNNPNAVWGSAGLVEFANWTGTAWVTTTYPAITLTPAQGTYVDMLAITFDSMNRPVIAYRGDVYSPTTTTNVYVAAWNGSVWDTSFGSIGDSVTSSFDILLTDAGNPVVTVANTDSSSGAYVWNGTSWSVTLGAGATEGSGAFDTNDSPVMLNSTTPSAWVPSHLTNSSWLPLVATSVPASSAASSPTITNTNDRLPIVGWYEPSLSPASIGLVRWTGTAWDNRAGFANNGFGANNAAPAVVVDARNNIWVEWTENLQTIVWMSNY